MPSSGRIPCIISLWDKEKGQLLDPHSVKNRRWFWNLKWEQIPDLLLMTWVTLKTRLRRAGILAS